MPNKKGCNRSKCLMTKPPFKRSYYLYLIYHVFVKVSNILNLKKRFVLKIIIKLKTNKQFLKNTCKIKKNMYNK